MTDKRSDRQLIKAIRDGLSVKRFHVVRHVAVPETVGHHTCNMINLIFILYQGSPPLPLVHRALMHDVPEAVTGDIPAHTKWHIPLFAEILKNIEEVVVRDLGIPHPHLAPLEEAVLRFVDILELCLKSIEEVDAGNEVFKEIFGRGARECMKILQGPLKEFPAAHELFEQLFELRKVEYDEQIH